MGSLATAFRPCITELARAGPILKSGTPYKGQLNCPIAVKATTLHLLESGVARDGYHWRGIRVRSGHG